MSVQIIISGENASDTLNDLSTLYHGFSPKTGGGETVAPVAGSAPVVEAPKTRKRSNKAESPAAPETLEPATLEEIHALVEDQEALYAADEEQSEQAAEASDVQKSESILNEAEPETAEDSPPVFITVEEVRAKMMELSRAGKKDVVQQILTDCKVSKLSDIPPDRYAEVMEAAMVALGGSEAGA